MFTGIVEALGEITEIKDEGTNRHFSVRCTLDGTLYIDQSIAHNGVCLTVVSIRNDIYTVTAIRETLDKTNLGALKRGDMVNLERSVTAEKRMDGHFVQGHVDTTIECTAVDDVDGSWYFHFRFDEKHAPLLVNKGSICINGVSLTIAQLGETSFSVAIIPYTYEHTTFRHLKSGDFVNIEFDVLGKYVQRYLSLQDR